MVQLDDTLHILTPIVRERAGSPGRRPPGLGCGSSASDSGLRITLIRRRRRGARRQLGAEPTGSPSSKTTRGRPEVRAALSRGAGSAVRQSATTGQSYVYAARTFTDARGRLLVLRLAEPLEAARRAPRPARGGHGARRRWRPGSPSCSPRCGSTAGSSSPSTRLIAGARDLAGGRASRVEVPDEDELAAARPRLQPPGRHRRGAVRGRAQRARPPAGDPRQHVRRGARGGAATAAPCWSTPPSAASSTSRARSRAGRCWRSSATPARPAGRATPCASARRRTPRWSSRTPERRTLLLASAALAGGERGAVVVARDTTELTRTADMRRDFVANVSHELKTPLAAIRGYAETLRDGALDETADGPPLLRPHPQPVPPPPGAARRPADPLAAGGRRAAARARAGRPRGHRPPRRRSALRRRPRRSRCAIEVDGQPVPAGPGRRRRARAAGPQPARQRHQVQPPGGRGHSSASPRPAPRWSWR